MCVAECVYVLSFVRPHSDLILGYIGNPDRENMKHTNLLYRFQLNLVWVVENETFKDQKKNMRYFTMEKKFLLANIFLTCGLNIISKCCGTSGPWMVPDRTLMVARCRL